MGNVIDDVLAERKRQIEQEGWSLEHDDKHTAGSLADAAGCYCVSAKYHEMGIPGYPPTGWPWSTSWWKPKDRRSDLVRAAALIIAEIERLDRADKNGASYGNST